MEDYTAMSRLLENMNASKFTPGSSHMVEVTHINDPKSFYVRLLDVGRDLPPLEQKGIQITKDKLKVGKLVVYNSKMLKKYVRGKIEFVQSGESNPEINIFALDYGCREQQVPLEQICEAVLATECPPLALHCQLHLCEPRGDDFDSEAIEAMRDFVGEHRVRITIITNNAMDKLTVTLKTYECPDDVATTLALLHYTTMMKTSNQVNRFEHSARVKPNPFTNNALRYKNKEIEVGEKLCVRVLSGDSIKNFVVAEINDYKNYVRWGSDFTQYCKRQRAVDVAAAVADGQCCGVMVGDISKYERAFVKEVIEPDSKVLVKLIDLGTEMKVNCAYIKSVGSKPYTSDPAIAIHCSSTEDQIWDNGLPRFLYPGYQFIIEIVKKGDGDNVPYTVKLYAMKSPFV